MRQCDLNPELKISPPLVPEGSWWPRFYSSSRQGHNLTLRCRQWVSCSPGGKVLLRPENHEVQLSQEVSTTSVWKVWEAHGQGAEETVPQYSLKVRSLQLWGSLAPHPSWLYPPEPLCLDTPCFWQHARSPWGSDCMWLLDLTSLSWVPNFGGLSPQFLLQPQLLLIFGCLGEVSSTMEQSLTNCHGAYISTDHPRFLARLVKCRRQMRTIMFIRLSSIKAFKPK